MIKVSDLRIGNLIKFKAGEGCVKVCSIDERSIWTKSEHNVYKTFAIDKYCGVPVTENNLWMCGFKWCNHYKAYTHEELYVQVFRNRAGIYCRLDDKLNENGEHDGKFYLASETEYVVSDEPIEYLHQLQNIFYALTKKELEVSLC